MNNEQIPNNNMNPGVVPQPNLGGVNPVTTPVEQQPGVVVGPAPAPEVVPAAPPAPETVPVAPAAPVAPDMMNQAPAQPLPNVNLEPVGVVQTPNVAPVAEPTVSPLMGTTLTSDTNLTQAPAPSMGGVPAPDANQIAPGQPGMVPPTAIPNQQMPNMGVPVPPQVPQGSTKEKKPMNKTLLIVLVVVLIAAIGGGVWYVLIGSKAKTPAVVITPFMERVELGVQLDTTLVSSFASVTGMSATDCTVETNIDTTKANTYEYKITCGSVVSGPNQVVVSDTQPPVVTLKEVVVVPDAEVKAEDFIATIEDASVDTKKDYVKFASEVSTATEGKFDVTLEITDLYGNTSTEVGKLIVDVNAPEYYYACNIDGEEENQKIQYRFGITSSDAIYSANKKVIFTYPDVDAYNTAVATYNESNELNGIKGTATFDVDNTTIVITTDIKVDDLPSEFDTDIFSEVIDIEDVLGDNCTKE